MLLCLPHIPSDNNEDNEIRDKMFEVSMINSSKSTFIIDIRLYKNLLNRLSEDFEKARITAHFIGKFYDFPSKQDNGGIIEGLKGRL